MLDEDLESWSFAIVVCATGTIAGSPEEGLQQVALQAC